MKLHAQTRRAWAFLTRRPNATLDEVAAHLGCSAASTALYHVQKLEDEGYVVTVGNRAREIVVPCFADWRIVPAPAHPGVNATEAR